MNFSRLVIDGYIQFNPENAESELPSKCETTDFFIHQPWLMENVAQFIVYSQIIKESHFASTFANVLKIITVPHDTNGQRVAISYGSDRVYLPVATNELNQVNSLNDAVCPLSSSFSTPSLNLTFVLSFYLI